MNLSSYFVDLHIHIGRDYHNRPVKITGAKTLTLSNILKEADEKKGLDMVGVIDCHAPAVQAEIQELIDTKQAKELKDGGIQFKQVTLILGSEIEIYDENCKGPIHVLCFFPTLASMSAFTAWLRERMTNINLSSQRYYGSARDLQYKVKELSGLFIPAHIFTPFKSLYGKGVQQSLREVLDDSLIDAVELGLSSDTYMVDGIDELNPYTFLTNSDAHSLGKMAREYQEVLMKTPSFKELYYAIHHVKGRKIVRNYGMNPLLGKYYHTVCKKCLNPAPKNEPCSNCGSLQRINGVKERIDMLKTNEYSRERPTYVHQVPLDFIPSLGAKTYAKLLKAFGTEMNIIHRVSKEELEEVVPAKLAEMILTNRNGELQIAAGGGGKYGKVVASETDSSN